MLSKREREVAAGISAGKEDREIALDLRISYLTVRGYVKTLYRKLGAHNRVSCMRAYLRLVEETLGTEGTEEAG